MNFTFELGDGPVILTVRSPVALNDRQWHYVRVERNVREASLQVDTLPLELKEAPSERPYRLQLSSQLFVGMESMSNNQQNITNSTFKIIFFLYLNI